MGGYCGYLASMAGLAGGSDAAEGGLVIPHSVEIPGFFYHSDFT